MNKLVLFSFITNVNIEGTIPMFTGLDARAKRTFPAIADYDMRGHYSLFK